MASLPNAGRAVVDDAKIREYLVSPTHPLGRFKAAFFDSIGFAATNWQHLRDELLALAEGGQAGPALPSPHGIKYEVHGTITGPEGATAEIMTVWIVRPGEDFPRLITAYPRS